MASPADMAGTAVTPERGRSRTRYPAHLSREVDGQGNRRPLLHRRGTSRTYETLEDLLKEAGYKETRIFTPEIDRHQLPEPDPEGSRSVRGAVVKLFSTWMSSPNSAPRRPPLPAPAPAPVDADPASLRRPRPSSDSLARIALRHAVSTSHLDKRRRQSRQSRPTKPPPPPLPPTWLESISAALRSPPPQPSSPPLPRKPSILTQRGHVRPSADLGPVTTITNVFCRSAPSSRSSSAVRPPRALLPSLAQTTVVCEEALPPHSSHRLPSPTPPQPDDDEPDELDLTMMLIPAKRQHSIRSLRSLLVQHDSLPAIEEYARLMRRRAEETDAEGHWDSGEFLTARVKRKRDGLPGNWGWSS